MLIETLEDEIQNLQRSYIELKTKYKAAKTELGKRNPSRKLEAENRSLEKNLEKCRSDLKHERTSLGQLKSENSHQKLLIKNLTTQCSLLEEEAKKYRNDLEKLNFELKSLNISEYTKRVDFIKAIERMKEIQSAARIRSTDRASSVQTRITPRTTTESESSIGGFLFFAMIVCLLAYMFC